MSVSQSPYVARAGCGGVGGARTNCDEYVRLELGDFGRGGPDELVDLVVRCAEVHGRRHGGDEGVRGGRRRDTGELMRAELRQSGAGDMRKKFQRRPIYVLIRLDGGDKTRRKKNIRD